MISDTAKMWLSMFGLDPQILEAATSDSFQQQIGALVYCIQHTHALAVEQKARSERIEAMLEDMLAERAGLTRHDDRRTRELVTAVLAAGPTTGATGGHVPTDSFTDLGGGGNAGADDGTRGTAAPDGQLVGDARAVR